eukprot:363205-Chlamydomonas_euryale.AAC.5
MTRADCVTLEPETVLFAATVADAPPQRPEQLFNALCGRLPGRGKGRRPYQLHLRAAGAHCHPRRDAAGAAPVLAA